MGLMHKLVKFQNVLLDTYVWSWNDAHYCRYYRSEDKVILQKSLERKKKKETTDDSTCIVDLNDCSASA